MKKSEEQQKREAMQAVQRANDAKALLSNPLYQEAIISMKAALFEEFEATKLDQEPLRHELWQRMQLLKLFEGKFESIVKHGVKGEQTLTLLERAKQKVGMYK